MSVSENILDILRRAYMQEVRAAIFYTELAGRTPIPHVSEKLLGMAHTEERHQKCVEQWYRLATGKKLLCTVSGGDLEGGARFDEAPLSIDKVMQMAIQAEKAAEGFYRRWAGRAQTEEERDLLELMADQEREHVMVLTEERVAMHDAQVSLAGVPRPAGEAAG